MIAMDLASYIAGLGLGWTVGVNLFVAHLPSKPDTCLVIYPYGGPPALGGKGYDNPALQVRSRSMDPATAYNQLAAVYNALDSLAHVTMGATRVQNVRGIQSEPISLGRDEAGRDEYTLNFQLRIRNQTVNRE